MSKSSMLKEGMKGGLNGLLSSTKKPSKEQISSVFTTDYYSIFYR